jgi:hypothetical protein
MSQFSRLLVYPLIILALLAGALGFDASVRPPDGGSLRPSAGSPPEGAITPEQAIFSALSELRTTPGGLRLENSAFSVDFDPQGLTFSPTNGAPQWRWQLQGIYAGDKRLERLSAQAVRPASRGSLDVAYARPGVVEQYLARPTGIEQQFVLPAALDLDGADLVITGKVSSAASFSATPQGWVWRNSTGAVSLGQVHVFDAQGNSLAAQMEVSPATTRIRVDGPALASAAYPVTIDPEIGANDFPISDMGSVTAAGAGRPAIAYSPLDNRYLVVWKGVENSPPYGAGESEIFGQFIDAATGAEVGLNDFRISAMGPDGDAQFFTNAVDVAYNSTNNEFLVVWSGTDNTGALVANESEIFAQRLSAAGAELGTDDFRISDMGPDGNDDYGAFFVALAYNSSDNEYLAVWDGFDDTAPLVSGEREIFGQRLRGIDAAQVGSNDFRISDMGPDGSTLYKAERPDISHNSSTNQYLVVWSGDDNTAPLVDEEKEIFGQLLVGSTGAASGTNDFRISAMGDNGNTSFSANEPNSAYNSANNQFIVVWTGDDNIPPLVNDEFEIFGQRLDATGAEIGSDDFRISDMGPDGNLSYSASLSGVTYYGFKNTFLVTWRGSETGLAINEFEVYGQRLNASTGAELGTNDIRLSNLGPDSTSAFGAFNAVPATNSTNDEFLVVFSGDDNRAGLIDGETEIFAQRASANLVELGENDFLVSDMGSATGFNARTPAAVYNPDTNQYLVVWSSDENSLVLAPGEFEIFGQLIDASTGQEVGANDFRISSMGPDGNPDYDALDPAVGYDDINYLVVWSADSNSGALVDNELEIYGRVITSNGTLVGADEFRISDMNVDGNANFDARLPAVAGNTVNNNFLVTWIGCGDNTPAVFGDDEVYGQLINNLGAELGTNDFRISQMGPDGDGSYGVISLDVAFNSALTKYVVVWSGDTDTSPLVNNEFEVFAALVGSTGFISDTNHRISDMGVDGDIFAGSSEVAITYNDWINEYLVVWLGSDDGNDTDIFGQRLIGVGLIEDGANDFRISAANLLYDVDVQFSNNITRQYLVVWSSDDGAGPLPDTDYEIFGQLLGGFNAAEFGPNDFRISDMGPDGDINYKANNPVVVFNQQDPSWMVFFSSDDKTGDLKNDRYEIFGQMLSTTVPYFLPVVYK